MKQLPKEKQISCVKGSHWMLQTIFQITWTVSWHAFSIHLSFHMLFLLLWWDHVLVTGVTSTIYLEDMTTQTCYLNSWLHSLPTWCLSLVSYGLFHSHSSLKFSCTTEKCQVHSSIMLRTCKETVLNLRKLVTWFHQVRKLFHWCLFLFQQCASYVHSEWLSKRSVSKGLTPMSTMLITKLM